MRHTQSLLKKMIIGITAAFCASSTLSCSELSGVLSALESSDSNQPGQLVRKKSTSLKRQTSKKLKARKLKKQPNSSTPSTKKLTNRLFLKKKKSVEDLNDELKDAIKTLSNDSLDKDRLETLEKQTKTLFEQIDKESNKLIESLKSQSTSAQIAKTRKALDQLKEHAAESRAMVKDLIDKVEVIRIKRNGTRAEQLPQNGKGQLASQAFQNFDQKQNQLYNLLSTVMKTIQESSSSAVRNIA